MDALQWCAHNAADKRHSRDTTCQWCVHDAADKMHSRDATLQWRANDVGDQRKDKILVGEKAKKCRKIKHKNQWLPATM